MFMDKDGQTLATEILAEVKASARRWFVAFLTMCFVEICTLAGFLWYISLPVEEGVIVENEDGNANYIGGNVGGDINNGTSDSLQETEIE